MHTIKTKPIYILLASLFLFTTSLFNSLSVNAGEYYGKQKVVYHINYDNPKKQSGALRNIQNHINAVGADNLDLKVVLHGHGVSLLLEPDALDKLKKFNHANANEGMTAKVDNLKSQGVDFNVCANTLKGRKVNRETDLYNVEKSDIVPSGVAELAKLQAMGYAYIKP